MVGRHLSVRSRGIQESELQIAEQANRMNVVVKKLSAWAAIILIPTLIAGIYAWNEYGGGPNLPREARVIGRNGKPDSVGRFVNWGANILHPATWDEFEGTAVARPLWGGLANIDEYEAEGPAGRIRGLTLRLYDPRSRQWSIYWANAASGPSAASWRCASGGLAHGDVHHSPSMGPSTASPRANTQRDSPMGRNSRYSCSNGSRVRNVISTAFRTCSRWSGCTSVSWVSNAMRSAVECNPKMRYSSSDHHSSLVRTSHCQLPTWASSCRRRSATA